jgi:plastocyanin
MQRIFTIFTLFFLLFLNTKGETVTINISGFTFSPNDVTIKLGDEIKFVVSSGHTATEVTQATWNANGNFPKSGGFNFGVGTNSFTPTAVGIIYYVCSPHASGGMKGKITVSTSTSIQQIVQNSKVTIYPNPTKNVVTIEVLQGNFKNIEILNILGDVIYRQTSVGMKQQFDFSNYPMGVYWIVIYNEKEKIIKKVQKI